MNESHPERQDPDADCPDWCEMHIDGRHVGALILEGSVNGSNVYTRLVGHLDGRVGFDVVVAEVNSNKRAATIPLTPDDIDQHALATRAMEADLRDSLAALETGTPINNPGDHPNR